MDEIVNAGEHGPGILRVRSGHVRSDRRACRGVAGVDFFCAIASGRLCGIGSGCSYSSKLLLPPSLCVPTGIGYWLRRACPDRSGGFAAAFGDSTDAGLGTWRRDPSSPAAMPTTQPLPRAPAGPGRFGRVRASHVAGGRLSALGRRCAGVRRRWVLQRLLFVRRLIAQSQPASRAMWWTCWTNAGGEWAFVRNVSLRLLPNSFSPAVCGLLRPTILMPAALLERLSPEGLQGGSDPRTGPRQARRPVDQFSPDGPSSRLLLQPAGLAGERDRTACSRAGG